MPLASPRPARSRALASVLVLGSCVTLIAACGDDGPRPVAYSGDRYALAGGCYVIDAAPPGHATGKLLASGLDAQRFSFSEREVALAARLTLEPTDLGSYLLRDVDGRYLYANHDGTLGRLQTLESDITRNEDGYVSPAVWALSPSDTSPGRFVLHSPGAAVYLGAAGLVPDLASAARVAFYSSTGCTPFPELTLDAHGEVQKTHFADGTLYGIVDAHEHVFTNLSFGAGGVYHGAPFHPLGVEHALSSCEQFHGTDGRRDLVGYFYGGAPFSASIALSALVSGDTGQFNHHTDGYPTFTDWPNAGTSTTHQTLYYRWIERAYRAGVRLFVQHATSNEVLCQLTNGVGTQQSRISCNDMVAADRIIEATFALERYVDAHAGGPGKGWLRVVRTPAEARQVIGDGKLAIILGIETSTLFDCYVNARPGYPKCDEALVKKKLDDYYARGVRALFPVHKFDNGFSAGDGMRGFIELGNIGNSGYYENFTDQCPGGGSVFDHGRVTFGGMNRPRDPYDGPAPIDVSALSTSPIKVFGPFLNELMAPPLDGEHCQAAGLQPIGEVLIHEMMKRGMIIEVDHLPQRSYNRAYELLHQYDYPAAGTHGSDNGGDLYALGGISTLGLPRCQDKNNPDVARDFRARIARIAAHGAYPAQGFGFDFNGFAGSPGPRFGKRAHCGDPQSQGITYPFQSYAGDVTFEAPHLGDRSVNFDTEGMLHLGLLPELIQDARNMGMSDADLEPLFRSAEGYLRMWERALTRSTQLQ